MKQRPERAKEVDEAVTPLSLGACGKVNSTQSGEGAE